MAYRLFISQPMRGLSIEQIKSDRERGLEYFKSIIRSTDYFKLKGITEDTIEVIDNLQEDAPEDYITTDYLSNDIKLLGRADGVLFLRGWKDARGCEVEYLVSKYYVQSYADGKHIFFEP